MVISDDYPPTKSRKYLTEGGHVVQVFGDFQDEPPKSRKYLILGFAPSSVNEQWQKKKLSIEFLGDYLTTFFPVIENEPSSLKKHRDVRDTTKYIANELLENAMKFNDHNVDDPVVLRLFLYQDDILFYVTNTLVPEAAKKFQIFLSLLPPADATPEVLEAFYIKQIEMSESSESGLGIITMIVNYGAKCGWKFETVHQDQCPAVTSVTTMVQVSV